MLSRIFTPGTYSPETSINTFSAAGTDFIDLPPINSNGDIWPETTQQVLQTEFPETNHRHTHTNRKETGLLQQYPDSAQFLHNINRRRGRHERSQQEALHCSISSQSLYRTFNATRYISAHYSIDANYSGQQRGGPRGYSYRDCSAVRGSSVRKRTDIGGGADVKPGAFGPSPAGKRLSRVAREVSDPGGEHPKPAARSAFIRTGRAEEERRASRSIEEEGFFVLDGGQDQGESSQGRGKGGKSTLSVKDRVAALDAKGKKEAATVTQRRPEEKQNVPIVYPLHYRRFVRRTTTATPLRPESPIYKSKLPMEEPLIHSPKPARSMPSLPAPPDTPGPANLTSDSNPSSTNDVTAASNVRNSDCKRKKYVQNRTEDNSVERITPASFLHRTRSNCVRHGRKRPVSSSEAQAPRARNMMAKSRSGAYIPTGLASRRQTEATSPWLVTNKSLTKTDAKHPDDQSDACPDCVAELSIKRRELNHGSVETIKRPVTQAIAKSAVDGPAPSVKRAVLSSTGADTMLNESKDEDLVISADLGNGLDAIIMEQGGELRRIVVNSRKSQPTIEIMQRLSQELAKVSSSIAFASAHQPFERTANRAQTRQCAVVVNPVSTPQDTKESSVPDLLDMIDQAANEIHVNTGKLAEHYVHRRDISGPDRHSLLSGAEFDDVMNGFPSPTKGLVGRQSMNEQYRNMHEHLLNATRKSSIMSSSNETSGVTQARQDAFQTSRKRPDQLPFEPRGADTQDHEIPSIIRTRPTMRRVEPKAEQITSTQTPPPEQPSIKHVSEFMDLPNSSSEPPCPTSEVQEPVKHHNPFHSWLNPFYHHEHKSAPAEPPKPTQPVSPMSTTPTPSLSYFTGSPVGPKPDLPGLPTPPGSVPQIVSLPNPYQHSPAGPPRLNYGEWANQRAREQQQVIKDAIRMRSNKAVQDASSAERDLRRQRSALGGERKTSMPKQ